MMISTKGRYALRVLVDLAEHADEGFVSMKKVAQRQEISLKYLERILPALVSGGLVEGALGRSGGYRLTRRPEEYTVGEILRLAEGNLSPVACLGCEDETCHRKDDCRTLPVWKELDHRVNSYLDSVSIADLMRRDASFEDSKGKADGEPEM